MINTRSRSGRDAPTGRGRGLFFICNNMHKKCKRLLPPVMLFNIMEKKEEKYTDRRKDHAGTSTV